MAELILGPMLRHVSETTATIWVETTERCTVEILGRASHTFCVAGHYYALVVLEGLEAASSTEYALTLDGELRWPRSDSSLPHSRIRTLSEVDACKIVFGSCRTAAPHDAPWSLELALDSRGRGVDALHVYAMWMVDHPEEEWPALAVFLGDQIYADDSSPTTRERIAATRERLDHRDPEEGLPPELVDGFEEYTWLYQESWSLEFEQWFFANVPTVMIFDDHDMIDDWNISDVWVREIRQTRWWQDHVIGGLMTYWLYQHLGNLSPETVRSEGLLEALGHVDDGQQVLRDWAMQAEEFTPVAGRYRFSFVRDIARVRLVMIDSRNVRVLEPKHRKMVDDEEWQWVVQACHADVDHLLIGTSLPAFVPGGLHDFQDWSEAICDGVWGWPGRKFGEWIRVKADMEDWAAFRGSFNDLVDLLGEVGGSSRQDAPATISVLAGDIHFSYASEIRFPQPMKSRVHQLVSSPIRNALKPPESTAMRLAKSRIAAVLGRILRRGAGRRRPALSWKIDIGPIFANSLGEITFDSRAASLCVLQACPHVDDAKPAFDELIEIDLVAGARSQASVPMRHGA